ncbi:MAG: hypothetical protein NXI27_19665 [Alphaproteobacteria bacterium]|nr:hypothetical protein [Alphaproteobacteria bacterium]
MADAPSDPAKILALFDHLNRPTAAEHPRCNTKIADQLSVLLAIRRFNLEGHCATCEALATHLELSIDRTIAAANALALSGFVEAFTTTIECAGGCRTAIAFRIPNDTQVIHFLERGA